MRDKQRWADWQVVAVVAAASAVGALVGPMGNTVRAVAVAHAVAQALPLLLRRRHPVATLVGTTAVVLAGALLGLPTIGAEFGPVAAAYAIGAYGRVRDAWALVPAVLALSAAQAGLVIAEGRFAPTMRDALISIGAMHTIAYLAGRTMRGRRDLAEQRTEQAVRDERARIARELHDVVAHHVGAMVIQAGAARRVVDERPERAREALEDIERAGREALEAMPALLGALRDGEGQDGRAPAVSLDRLDDLVERMRAVGLSVHVAVDGERRALPPQVDLSAYRVIQEALTNAAKHAGPARVDVRLRYEPDALVVAVSDDGQGPADGFAERGHGLLGMRERAALLGGSLDAGPRPGGGFAVEARLPVGGAA